MKIIQIGSTNWQETTAIPSRLEWIFLPPHRIASYLKEEEERLEYEFQEKNKKADKDTKIKRKRLSFDAVVLTDKAYSSDIALLEKVIEPYHVFFDKDLEIEDAFFKHFLNRTLAQPMNFKDREGSVYLLSKILFKGQFGQKMAVEHFLVNPDIEGEMSYEGKHSFVIEGDFGEDYRVLGSYAYGVDYRKQHLLELWQEYVKDDSCQIKLLVKRVPEGAVSEIAEEFEFDEKDMLEPSVIDCAGSGNLQVTLLIKGKGRIEIGPLHYRWSRGGFGQFTLGGQRFCDSNRQEFHYFFHPGDFKPPLCVYFSGFRSAEGFEGYGMMRKMGVPMLLICDPRLEGGSFYLGTEAFEQKIPQLIQHCLDFLGFTNKELILSGMSMGTFGATYYGAELDPHAIILAKPVFNLGRVATFEKTSRPEGFTTSLDILLHFEKDLSKDAQERLDRRFWQKCISGRYTDTKFFVAYMKNDDYDHTAFFDLMDELSDTDVQVVGKGWTGRHTDGSNETVPWFLSQYYKVLATDFGRGDDRVS